MAPAVRGQRHQYGGVEVDMQLFIALGLLITMSTAYLLHQYWSRSLERDEPSAPAEPAAHSDNDQLKAA